MRIQHLYNPNRYADVSKQQWDDNPRFKLYWRIVEEDEEEEKKKQKKIRIPKEVEENEEID